MPLLRRCFVTSVCVLAAVQAQHHVSQYLAHQPEPQRLEALLGHIQRLAQLAELEPGSPHGRPHGGAAGLQGQTLPGAESPAGKTSNGVPAPAVARSAALDRASAAADGADPGPAASAPAGDASGADSLWLELNRTIVGCKTALANSHIAAYFATDVGSRECIAQLQRQLEPLMARLLAVVENLPHAQAAVTRAAGVGPRPAAPASAQRRQRQQAVPSGQRTGNVWWLWRLLTCAGSSAGGDALPVWQARPLAAAQRLHTLAAAAAAMWHRCLPSALLPTAASPSSAAAEAPPPPALGGSADDDMQWLSGGQLVDQVHYLAALLAGGQGSLLADVRHALRQARQLAMAMAAAAAAAPSATAAAAVGDPLLAAPRALPGLTPPPLASSEAASSAPAVTEELDLASLVAFGGLVFRDFVLQRWQRLLSASSLVMDEAVLPPAL